MWGIHISHSSKHPLKSVINKSTIYKDLEVIGQRVHISGPTINLHPSEFHQVLFQLEEAIEKFRMR